MFRYIFALMFLIFTSFGFELVNVVENKDNSYTFNVKNFKKSPQIGFITNDRIITCEPDVAGAFEYLNDKQIVFYPKKPLNKGKEYVCGNANGRISFQTSPFEVQNLKVLDDRNLMLSFNDKVDIDELRLKLKAYIKENLAKNDVKFKAKTNDNLNFLISFDKSYENLYLYLPNNLKSKVSAKLDVEFNQEISSQNIFFKDSLNASSLKDIKVSPFSFDDGLLGFKIGVKSYIGNADKKYIKVSNIKNFSLSDIRYNYKDEYFYEFFIKSNDIKANSKYVVEILPGFGDNYTINRERRVFSVKTGDIKPFAKFSDDKPYVAKNSIIAFKSANLNSVKITIDKVSEQNYRYFLNYDSDLDKLTKNVISKNFDLNNSLNIIEEHRLKFDFNDFKDGVYKISIYYKDDKNQMNEISKKVYFSDISALATMGNDGIFVFTSRLSTAKPLPDTEITIYNKNNEIIAKGNSDKNGIYKFEDDKFLDKNPKSIFIKNKDEESFLILDEPINDDYLINKDTKYKALTYLASDIIRPKESIEGMVVLKDYNFKAIKNLPIKIKIINPQNKIIKTISKNTDEFGAVEIDEIMGELSGIYTINVEFANKLVDSKKFSVESFIPQRIKNEIITSKDEFIKFENIDIKLMSNYLFGGFAPNLTGSLTLSYSPKELKFDNYKDFSFSNQMIDSKTILDNKFFNISLNDEGKKSFITNYNKDLEVSNALNLNLNFSILDNTKTVSEYKNLTIYPYKTLTGIKANKDFIDSGDEVKFSVISLDSLSKKEKNSDIKISIYAISWNYFLEDNSYKEQKEFNLIDNFYIKNGDFKYKFESGGDYLVVANDYLSGSSASFSIYVNGWGGYATRSAKDIKKANIVFGKNVYKAGDKINININSAIEKGLAIISLVDKKILEQKIVEIGNNKAVASFDIPLNFTKGYVNVVVVREAKQLATPLRTYANKAIKIDKTINETPLNLTFKNKALNGELINIKIKTIPNSKVAIFIADEGILQIINQKELNAFKYFDITAPINVLNYDIYDLLSTYTSNAKALSFGGDAMLEMARTRDLNPVKAKDIKTFKIVKYLISDENGEANFEFKSPENFNSKVRVTAISLNDNKISSKNGYIEIKDDIIVKSGVITYLIKGDELKLPITLLNTTDKKKNLILDFSSSPNLKFDVKDKTIVLEPFKSTQIEANISALKLGDSKFIITLKDDNNSYKSTTNLTIISPYPKKAFFDSGFLKNNIEWNMTNESYKEVFISISNSPKAALRNLSKKLIEYPYGCTEQISTKILAMANLLNYSQDDKKEIDKNIEFGFKNLILRLKDDGSFGYWSKFSDTNIFASIYTSDVLLELDKSRNLLSKAQEDVIYSYLKMPHQDPFLMMYASYILSQNKSLELSTINYLFDNKIYKQSLLTHYMMAGILKENNLNSELNLVLNEINSIDINELKSYDYNLNFNSDIRDMAFALYIHSNHFKPNKVSDNIASYLSSNLNTLNSTQKIAFVLRAFKNYFKDEKKDLNYEFFINGKNTNYDKPLNSSFDLVEPKFGLKTYTPLYYGVISFGNKKLDVKNFAPILNDEYFKNKHINLNIYREFVDINGNKVDLNTLKLNQTIFSKIELFTNTYLFNVLVDEQISPCFEVINERIFGSQRSNATKNSITFEYQDIKDERVVSFLNGFSRKAIFFTPLKVVMSGKCTLPVVKTEFMQNEDIWDYDLEMENFEIKK